MPTLPEIEDIYARSRELDQLGRLETLATVKDKRGDEFPLLKFSVGSTDPKAPVLGIIGGVHGLERIGAQVAIAYLNSLANLMVWDETTKQILEKIRIFFIPVANPTGIYHHTRSNAEGIDLMRNSPVESDAPTFLLSGHRYSNRLPWYRGAEGAPLQIETIAIAEAIRKEISDSVMAITLDIHSGFGTQDQIWSPYAKTRKPFPHLPLFHSMIELFDQSYPYHPYRAEPQALNYTTHGDLWDYIYDQHRAEKPDSKYLALCLEMGSWAWVKKNPLQIFYPDGAFNPVKKHRERRILRRHNTFFQFLQKALVSHENWASLNPEQWNKHHIRSLQRWYPEQNV